MKHGVSSFIERHKGGERAILVHIQLPHRAQQDLLHELEELARSDGAQVLATITGSRPAPDPKYFIGTGKANEIRDAVASLQAEVVIFNHALSPAQGRNLEDLFKCRVLDRTELILDIFAQRARTFEGKLQVELAQLQHLRTCLVGGWTHLERQRGGIGLRGPGETQLESDRRIIDAKIKNISKRLDKVLVQRQQSRRARQRAELPIISLVGYTNAGKSTLFNCLTESDVYTAHQLFATLDPTIRQIKLQHVGKLILADTVGFIRELPHDLVAAFRATLEEVHESDLLLHVVDCQQYELKKYIEAVNDVLAEIGAAEVPQLFVFNKIDLSHNLVPRIDRNDEGRATRVWISATKELGFDLLELAIVELLRDRLVHTKITLKPEQGKLRARLYELGVVLAEHVNEEGLFEIEVEMQQGDYQRLLAKTT